MNWPNWNANFAMVLRKTFQGPLLHKTFKSLVYFTTFSLDNKILPVFFTKMAHKIAIVFMITLTDRLTIVFNSHALGI